MCTRWVRQGSQPHLRLEDTTQTIRLCCMRDGTPNWTDAKSKERQRKNTYSSSHYEYYFVITRMFLCKFPFWSYTRVEDGSDSVGDGSVWNNHWSSINRFALKFRKTTVAPPSHDTPGSGGYLKGIISPHLPHYQTYSNKFSVCHSLPFGDGRGDTHGVTEWVNEV